MHRRTFLQSFAAASAVQLWGADTPVAKRKSASPTNPDPPELKGYKKAVALMKALPADDPRSWKAQANIHNDYCPHSNWWFLPWHRAYLYYFEAVCQDVLDDPKFTLPYWDWTRNQKLPAAFLDQNSPLYESQRESNVGIGAGIAGPSIIRTIMRSGSLVVPFSGSTTTDEQREESTTGQLEGGPHNGVHGTVGGTMGTYLSPLDPIFWLHHCNIDRLWASWAGLHGNAVPSQPLWGSHNLGTYYDPKQKKQVTVPTSDTKNAAQFNAVYDRLETLAARPRPVSPQLQSFVMGLKGELPRSAGPQAIFSEAVPAPATRGGTAMIFSVKPEQRQQTLLRSANAETFLLIEGLPKPGNLTTAFRVFLNTKEVGPSTPVSSPGYAGSIAFFGDGEHAGHGGQRTFILDVATPLSALGPASSANVDVALLPVNLSGGATGEVSRPAKVQLLALG